MAQEEMFIGILLLVVFFLIAWGFSKYYNYKWWTIPISIHLITLSLFFFPTQNYSWTEYLFDNVFAWLVMLIIIALIHFIIKDD